MVILENRKNSERRVVGVLIGDVSFDFTSELMAGILDAAQKANLQAVFLLGMQKHSPQSDYVVEDITAINHNSVYDYSTLTGADAFIVACGSLTGFSGDGLYKQFFVRFENQPYVVLQEPIEIDTPRKTYIVVDNYNSFYQCVEHLIEVHGYRKIAFMSGPQGHADARERMRAYVDCMEKHGLNVTPEMIAFGDYYEYVDDLVCKLFEENPGLEAIAFANDEMAKAGYRECRRRGLTVGRDFAIIGFDNFNTGRTMEPPLTTVSQDVYQMGKTSVERVICLMNGEMVPPLVMKTEFLCRQSCGCVRETACFSPNLQDGDAERFISYAIDGIVEGFGAHFTLDERAKHTEVLRGCLDYFKKIALEQPDQPLDYHTLSVRMNDFFDKNDQPVHLILQCLQDFMLQYLRSKCDSQPIRKFAVCISRLQQYLHLLEVRSLKERFDHYQAQSWLAPELTRGLFDRPNDQTAFRSVTERLISAGLRHVYICLLEKPQRYYSKGLVSIPQKLLLAACSDNGVTVAYPRGGMPIVDAQHPFRSLPGFAQMKTIMGFSIFSGENQYGILLCETDRSKNTLLHVIGLQLGMLIDFLVLRQKEIAITEELEDIREKNEILNFLSEYDPMCGLPNRRGFIERAIRCNRENIGKTAYCAFLDLDYLKQINDTFGHPEGDNALKAISGMLLNIAGKNDVIGRIGGDEFVGLFITENTAFQQSFEEKLQKECLKYNNNTFRPYLLDVSAGVARFTCKQGLEISMIIAEADKYLYEAKRGRSASSLRLNPSYIKPGETGGKNAKFCPPTDAVSKQ